MNEEPRTLQGDLSRLQESLGSVVGEAERRLRLAVTEQPLLALGAAAGLGFLLGGGISRSAAGLVIGAGARLAGAWLEQEFNQRANAQEDDEI